MCWSHAGVALRTYSKVHSHSAIVLLSNKKEMHQLGKKKKKGLFQSILAIDLNLLLTSKQDRVLLSCDT